jgi:hypothetical protein
MTAELAEDLIPPEEDRLLQAEALVRSYCGWHIAPSRTDTYTPAGTGPGIILLPSLYVTAVSVTRNGVVQLEDVDFTRYGLAVTLSYWGSDDLVIEFDHGYETPPADVTAVVQAIAQRAVDNPSSLVREQVGPFAYTYSTTGTNQSLPIALTDAERAVLAPYRIIKVT